MNSNIYENKFEAVRSIMAILVIWPRKAKSQKDIHFKFDFLYDSYLVTSKAKFSYMESKKHNSICKISLKFVFDEIL